MENVKEKINSVLRDIQLRNSYKSKELNDECKIVQDLGFSSLDIAELIALLEMELGVDPFSEGVSIMDVHKIGELHQVYQASFEQKNAMETA